MKADGSIAYQEKNVVQGDRYTDDFERCWQAIAQDNGKSFYLGGTNQSLAELLSPAWEITGCARCGMPTPIAQSSVQTLACPCEDLDNWPDLDTIRPRPPVSSQTQLSQISQRLHRANAQQAASKTDATAINSQP